MTGDEWAERPGFDVWADLPDELRAAILAAGDRGWKRAFTGISTYNEVWRPLRPVLMRKEWLERLYALSDRMLQLVLECCRRRAGTAGELQKLLGIPPGRLEFLDENELLGDHLVMAGRPDVVVTGGVPKFVEFNVGSDVGSVWDSEKVSERFLRLFRTHGLADRLGAEVPPSAVDARYAAIRQTLGLADGARLAMVYRTDEDFPESDDPAELIKALEPFIQRGREHGYDMAVLPVDWLELDEQDNLVGNGRRVEVVLRKSVCADMPASPGREAISGALRAGTATIFTSAASWLLGNKVVLAWLWEDADQLPAADAELIRTHVPRTRLLTPALLPAALAEQERLVLKPTDRFGGAGVLLGREASPADWATAIGRAVDEGLHLVQEYARPDRVAMDFVHLASGRREQAAVPVSLGPYSFGRRGAGCCVRIGSQQEGEVLNLQRNVHVTGPLLVDVEPT
jgi:glutathionylspermidine synthase